MNVREQVEPMPPSAADDALAEALVRGPAAQRLATAWTGRTA
jgi:hypothetical protein